MIRLGTRGSELATTQSETVAAALRARGHAVELVIIRTTGDRLRGSLTNLRDLGVFAAELRTALLDGECDLAVHSAKDLPVAPVDGLELVAFPERADSRDVLCARDGLTLQQLPAGGRVGTGSPRRAAQLRAIRPDLDYVDIRGNIGTRLARIAPGDLDAVVLAAAGLERLGRTGPITQYLDLLPSPGQGALAVECRADSSLRDVLAELDHPPTRVAVEAERRVLAELGGGCAAPIGVRAELRAETVHVRAGVFAVAGSASVIREAAAPDADAAGFAVAEILLADGAGNVTNLQAARSSRLPEFHDDLWSRQRPLEQARVLVAKEPSRISEGLEAAGMEVTCLPVQQRRTLDDLPERLPSADWVALTSPRTVQTLGELGWTIPAEVNVAVVGESTRRAAEAAGIRVDLVPEGPSSAKALLAVWPETGQGSVLVPGSQLSSGELVNGLNATGWQATALPLYTMEPVSDVPPETLDRWREGYFDAVLVCSGSGARAVEQVLGWPEHTRVVALGVPTADALASLNIEATVALTQDPAGVLLALTEALAKENPA